MRNVIVCAVHCQYIKYRSLRWTEQWKNTLKYNQISQQEKYFYEGLGVDERTKLELILKTKVSVPENGLILLRTGIIGKPCEYGIEPRVL